MPRPTTTPARQAQIAAALRRLLPTKGFSGASIKAIAQEAQLAPGLVHHHFTSKAAILMRVVDDLAEALQQRAPQTSEGPADIHALIDAWLLPGPGADAQAVLCWAAIGAEAARRDDVRQVYAAAVARQVDRFTEALSAHAPGRPPEDLRGIAVMLYAAIEGSFRLHASAPGTIPPGAAAPALHALVDAWLTA